MEKLNNDDAIDNDILVNEVKKKICSNDIIHNLAFFYKIMGDNTRLNLLMVLEFGELCVSDLAYLLNMSIWNDTLFFRSHHDSSRVLWILAG